MLVRFAMSVLTGLSFSAFAVIYGLQLQVFALLVLRANRAGNFVSWRLFQLRVESREHGEAHGQNTSTGRDCGRGSW
jgi:hypothetical protein